MTTKPADRQTGSPKIATSKKSGAARNAPQDSNPTTKLRPADKNSGSSGQPFSKTVLIMGALLAATLLALTFIGGFAAGKKSAARKLEQIDLRRKQLTENLDRPIKDRPLLKNLSQKTKSRLKKHGLAGSLIEVGDNALVIDTPEGARSVLINEQTKIVEGHSKKPLSIEDLRPGAKIVVLGQPDQDNQSDNINAKVIIIGGPDQPRARDGDNRPD